MIARRVDAVTGIVGGKLMITREVGLGAHIEVIVLRRREYGIESGGFDDAYRPGGESFVAVCVIRRFGFQKRACDASCREVAGGEFQSGVALEFHAFFEAVYIQACHFGLLVAFVGFFFDD